MMLRRFVPFLLAALAPAAAAPAEEPSPDVASPAAEERQVEIEIAAGAWLPRLGGSSALGGAELDFADDLDADDLEATPRAELTMRWDDWRLVADAFSFSTDGAAEWTSSATTFGGVSIGPGDRVETSFDFESFGLELARRVTGSESSRAHGTRGPSRFDLVAFVGARWLGTKQVLESDGEREEIRGRWTAAYLGVGFELRWSPEGGLPLGEGLMLDTSAGGGLMMGGDGGTAWLVRASIRWELTERFDLLFGYRLLELDGEDEDYDLDAGLQGLFVGAAIRF